jgi:hypothetical protein
MKTIVAFEILDHGIEYSDYFQGCGVACTEYTDVATGIGNSEEEALSDALDSLAQGEWDTEGCKGLAEALANASKKDAVSAFMAQNYASPCEECDADDCDGCDYEGSEEACDDCPHYHVSVRVRGSNDAETADAFAEHHWPAVSS